VVALELPSYQRKENWGAAETFYQIVRTLAARAPAAADAADAAGQERSPQRRPRCNILGPSALGFRHRDDLREISGLLGQMGIDIHVVAPLGASPQDIARLPEADFNVVLYPEVASVAAQWLKRTHGQPCTTTIPIGVGATRAFITEVAALAGVDASALLAASPSRASWYARSVDSTYLTGKRVFVFGDATHAVAAARVAADELGFKVVGIGTYAREFAREVREAAKHHGVDALISDDYLDVEARVQELQPDLVLGSQMERHIAKRLGVPCAVISGPVHVQDFPARYSPQMGFEGANVLFDTWVHPLMMGLEEHLIGMFRGDFEFHGDAAASHLGHAATRAAAPAAEVAVADAQASSAPAVQASSPASVSTPASAPAPAVSAPAVSAPAVSPEPAAAAAATDLTWHVDAESELRKIPFFVRGKARRNTERFALERGLPLITLETLYDAKAHFSR
jgi:light-independent protochlorophyllide reductase subunit B